MPDRFEAQEQSSAVLAFQVKDEDGVGVPGSSLSAVTLPLKDQATGAVINSRNAQDVRGSGTGANNVTIATDGTITWAVQPADNAIQVPSTTRQAVRERFERHVAVFDIRWNAGAKRLLKDIVIDVANVFGV